MCADQQAPNETALSITPKKIPIRMSNRTIFHKRDEIAQFRDVLPQRQAQNSKPASKSTTNKRANAIRTSLIMSNIHSILKRIDSQAEEKRTESQVRVKISNFVQPGPRRPGDERATGPAQSGHPRSFQGRLLQDASDQPDCSTKRSHADATQFRAGILKLSRKSRQGSVFGDKENFSNAKSLKRAESGILPDLASSSNLATNSAVLHLTMSAKHRTSKTPLHELNNMTNLFDSNASRVPAQKTPGVSKKEAPQVLVKTKKFLIKSNSNYIEGFG